MKRIKGTLIAGIKIVPGDFVDFTVYDDGGITFRIPSLIISMERVYNPKNAFSVTLLNDFNGLHKRIIYDNEIYTRLF